MFLFLVAFGGKTCFYLAPRENVRIFWIKKKIVDDEVDTLLKWSVVQSEYKARGGFCEAVNFPYFHLNGSEKQVKIKWKHQEELIYLVNEFYNWSPSA